MYALICAHCGLVLARVAHTENDKRRCERCHQHTIFTIINSKARATKATLTHDELDHLMRNNKYVDRFKC